MGWWRKARQLDPQEFLAETMKLLEVEFQPLVFQQTLFHEHAVVYTVDENIRRVVTYYPLYWPFITHMDLARAQLQFAGLLQANPEGQFQFQLLCGTRVHDFYHDIAFGANPSFSLAGSMLQPVDAFYHLRNVPVRAVNR